MKLTEKRLLHILLEARDIAETNETITAEYLIKEIERLILLKDEKEVALKA